MAGYDPSSSWNDYPTLSQLSDLRRAWMKLNYDYTEADIPETRWEARNLQHELWGKVRRLQSKSQRTNRDTCSRLTSS